MVARKENVERRKNKRHKAIESTFAAINPNSQKIGEIIDISYGGICFKYIYTNNGDQDFKNQQEDSISLSSRGYYVKDLPFKTVCDYEITNVSSFSSMKIRKRHIQFADLNSKQLFDLDCFLRNNIIKES